MVQNRSMRVVKFGVSPVLSILFHQTNALLITRDNDAPNPVKEQNIRERWGDASLEDTIVLAG